MKRDVLAFISEIKLNTGIQIGLYSLEGAPLLEGLDNIDFSKFKVGDFYYEEPNNRAFFPLSFNGKSVIACVVGNLEQTKSYAFLIAQLARSQEKAEPSKEEFCASLLYGEGEPSKIKKLARKYNLPEKSLFAMVISCPNGKVEVLQEFLQSYLSSGDFFVVTDDDRLVLVKSCNEDIDDYSSCAEYADYLTLSVYEETGVRIKIGVGSIVDGVEKTSVSYTQALSTIDMMDVLNSSGDVHTYKEYVLIKILGEMPKNKLNSYLNLLLDGKSGEVLSDEEILSTAQTFLDNNLNVSETSRKMFLHRNTLNYRLEKIEKTTGLDIRNFSDAMTFRLITILSKLIR